MLTFPFPYIANTAGWMTAEMGRQPWLVYGLMRTADGFSPTSRPATAVHADRLHGYVPCCRFSSCSWCAAKSITGPSRGCAGSRRRRSNPTDYAEVR